MVADGEDHFMVVIRNSTLDGSLPLGLNCQVFLDSCFRLQFSLCKNIPDMKADILICRLEEFGDEGDACPSPGVTRGRVEDCG